MSELALYGMSTKRFNEQVRSNRERFPADFMFQLAAEELAAFKVAICDLEGWPRTAPQIPAARLTEHGSSWSPSYGHLYIHEVILGP